MKHDHCDFCIRQGTAWVLPANDFHVIENYGSTGAWAVCDGCKIAYEQAAPDEWAETLIERALTSPAMRDAPAHVRESARQSLAIMYAKLAENVTGPIISDEQWVAECDHAEFVWQDKTTTLREPGFYCDRCGFPQDRMMILPDAQAREID